MDIDAFHLDDPGHPRSIAVVTGEPFTIEIGERPTTGYTWQLVIDPAVEAAIEVEDVSSVRTQVSPGFRVPGARGARRFRLRALQAGSFELAFVLKRRWETTELERRTVTIDASHP